MMDLIIKGFQTRLRKYNIDFAEFYNFQNPEID